MIQTALEHEPALRFGAFLAVFAAMAIWEAIAPRRRADYARTRRWPNNLGLVAVDVLVVRLLAPGVAIAVAAAGEFQGLGLLNMFASPWWLKVLLGVVLLRLISPRSIARTILRAMVREGRTATWFSTERTSRCKRVAPDEADDCANVQFRNLPVCFGHAKKARSLRRETPTPARECAYVIDGGASNISWQR